MSWLDCPTPAASGAVAKVKSVLCAEPGFTNVHLVLSLLQSSTLSLFLTFLISYFSVDDWHRNVNVHIKVVYCD